MAPDVASTLAARHRSAQRHIRRRNFFPALTDLSALLLEVDVPAAVYDSWVKTLILALSSAGPAYVVAEPAEARTLATQKLRRLRAVCHLYLGSPADRKAADSLLAAELFPVERAIFLESLGEAASPEQLGAAGDLLLQRGRPVRAASAYVAAGRREDAIRCYQTLLATPPGASGAPGMASSASSAPWTAYEQALVHFQLAVLLTMAGGSSTDILRHAVAAQTLLEQLADEHEATEQPERAIDVYCVYIALGRATARFENIAEGFVGCLRLLKQERLITAALRCYEDFLACCVEWGEFLLAGQQARDAAEFLDQCGLPWGDSYRRRAAEFFERAGGDERREPAYRESLLVQAVSLYSALADQDSARRTLLRLADLPTAAGGSGALSPTAAAERSQRYRRLAGLYPSPAGEGAGDADKPSARAEDRGPPPAPEAAPPHLDDRSGELPVWDLDLCEWEDAGQPDLIAFAILCDRRRPLVSRRQALRVLMLHDLSPPAPWVYDPTQARLELVDALAGLRCYEALRPLEELLHAARPVGPIALSASNPEGEWRTAILRRPQTTAFATDLFSDHTLAPLRRRLIESLPRLHYRRALAMVVRSLADADIAVFAASLAALSHGRYIGSVSLLSRLLDGSEPSLAGVPLVSRLDVQRAALVALSRVRELRAYQIILDVYRREAEPLRSDAFRLLRYALEADSNTVRPLLLRAAQGGDTDLGKLGALVGD
jgi:tetratricopeptide (TPR) repeat protein